MNTRRLRMGIASLGLLVLAAPLTWAGTLDRLYRLGDDSFEAGIANAPAGVTFGGQLLTLDSIGTPGANDLNDLQVVGGPFYASVSGRPGATSGQVGIRFDGVNDYLRGDNLNGPANSRSSIDYVDDNNIPSPGPFNYRGIVNRSFQFWVRPDAAGFGDGLAQALVVDSNQHGALIGANDNWVMRYAGVDVDSGVAATTNWSHVMVARPFGPSGPTGGSRMWVNGVAVAARGGGYDASSREALVVGANTGRDTSGNFTGGSADFFRGTLDDISFAVYGNNSTNQGPPPGMDYGSFNFRLDNEFAARTLNSLVADLNQDNQFNALDRAAYIAGWRSEKLVNGFRTGDLTSFAQGDVNFDGINDIRDLAIFQQALAQAGLRGIEPSELVPEPSGVGLVCLAVALGFVRRRR